MPNKPPKLTIPAYLGVLALVCAVLSQDIVAQQSATPGDPDVDRYVSNLSSLYADYKAWDAERAYILQKIDTIGQVKGTGSQSAKALADELDAISDLRTRAAKDGPLRPNRKRSRYTVGNRSGSGRRGPPIGGAGRGGGRLPSRGYSRHRRVRVNAMDEAGTAAEAASHADHADTAGNATCFTDGAGQHAGEHGGLA